MLPTRGHGLHEGSIKGKGVECAKGVARVRVRLRNAIHQALTCQGVREKRPLRPPPPCIPELSTPYPLPEAESHSRSEWAT
jgi:hypothetical protein